MSQLKIRASEVFHKNFTAHTRFVNNEGGARSSKTYSICQKYIVKALNGWRGDLTVTRYRLTWLRDTAMKDFFDILKMYDLYSSAYHNKSSNQYTLNGSRFNFIGMDEEQKFRGRKQNDLWVNEINESEYEAFSQAIRRTTGQVTWDFNPSDEYHWLYEHFLDSPIRSQDITTIHSTYKDNPFLDPVVKNELEMLEREDEDSWRVYGLGLRATAKETIYKPIVCNKELYTGPDAYGLDFGYNHPTVLVGVKDSDAGRICNEYIHESYLMNHQLIQRMNEIGIKKDVPIYADSARPEIIAEIKDAGYWIQTADKSVFDGIKECQAKPLFITDTSTKSIKQLRNYKWKVKDTVVLDEPVKFEDDAPDAIRYAVFTGIKKQNLRPSRIRLINRR